MKLIHKLYFCDKKYICAQEKRDDEELFLCFGQGLLNCP